PPETGTDRQPQTAKGRTSESARPSYPLNEGLAAKEKLNRPRWSVGRDMEGQATLKGRAAVDGRTDLSVFHPVRTTELPRYRSRKETDWLRSQVGPRSPYPLPQP